jgi:hypothetical protein
MRREARYIVSSGNCFVILAIVAIAAIILMYMWNQPYTGILHREL